MEASVVRNGMRTRRNYHLGRLWQPTEHAAVFERGTATTNPARKFVQGLSEVFPVFRVTLTPQSAPTGLIQVVQLAGTTTC